MTVKFNRSASGDDLLFTVEMALRKASRLWPKRHLPDYHNRLNPVAKAVADRIEHCGMRCFGKSPGSGPLAPPGGAADRGGRETSLFRFGLLDPVDIGRRQAPGEHLLGKRIIALGRAPQVRFGRGVPRRVHARHHSREGVSE